MRDAGKIRFARHLRRHMTDAEHALWFYLRNRTLMDCKFRRQHPLGPYVADFACLEHRLVVEVDGSQHLDSTSDPRRDADIEARGYRILRFWNNDVLLQPLTVLSVIFDALAEARASFAAQDRPPVRPAPASRAHARGAGRARACGAPRRAGGRP